MKGYELWADTVNAKGGLLGRKVSLKIVDDASNPTQVVTNYENLITADHVNLVFGPFSSLLTIPAATIAKPLRLCVHRAFRRGSPGLRPASAQPVPGPARSDRELGRRIR